MVLSDSFMSLGLEQWKIYSPPSGWIQSDAGMLVRLAFRIEIDTTSRILWPMTITRTYHAFRIGSSCRLTEVQLQQLADLFNRPTKKAVEALAGRSSVSVHQILGMGRIVIKYYTRGGLLFRLVKRRYLKWGKPRAQREFELLRTVAALNVNVPEPIAYADCGHLFYRAWLVTREIHQSMSLARLSLQDEKKSRHRHAIRHRTNFGFN